MSKKIKSLSQDFEAFKVPTHAFTEYDGFWLKPGGSMEITEEQAEAEDIKAHEAAGRIKVTPEDDWKVLVENISNYIVYFAVPGQTYQFSQQFVLAPGGEVTLTDEQAASPSVQEFLESGKADDPDDDLAVRGGSGKMYKKFADAIKAGETEMKLMSDLTEQVTIAAGKTVKIDLGGNELKSATTSTGCIDNRGELTLIDTVGGGLVEATKNFGIISGTGSKLVIGRNAKENMTVKGVEGAVITGKSVGADITINGGKFIATDNAVIMGNGSQGFGKNKIAVNGGEFESHIVSAGYLPCAIYCPTDDEITINGGEFITEEGCGICSRAGIVTVNGGKFITTGEAEGYVGDSKSKVPCSALVFDVRAGYPQLTDESKILVKGGTFKSKDACIAEIGGEGRVIVEGGTFDPAL